MWRSSAHRLSMDPAPVKSAPVEKRSCQLSDGEWADFRSLRTIVAGAVVAPSGMHGCALTLAKRVESCCWWEGNSTLCAIHYHWCYSNTDNSCDRVCLRTCASKHYRCYTERVMLLLLSRGNRGLWISSSKCVCVTNNSSHICSCTLLSYWSVYSGNISAVWAFFGRWWGFVSSCQSNLRITSHISGYYWQPPDISHKHSWFEGLNPS